MIEWNRFDCDDITTWPGYEENVRIKFNGDTFVGKFTLVKTPKLQLSYPLFFIFTDMTTAMINWESFHLITHWMPLPEPPEDL